MRFMILIIICRVRRLFRPAVLSDSMVKLRDGEIKWITKHVVNGSLTTRQTAEIYELQ